MSSGCKHTEVVTPNAAGWTQIDTVPLVGRQYVEVLLNATDQRMGVVFTSGAAPSGAWNTGQIVMPGDASGLVPAGVTVKCYVRMESGAVASGAGIILREWAA